MEFGSINIAVLGAVFSGLIFFGMLFYVWQSRMETRARNEVKKRLDIDQKRKRSDNAISSKAATDIAKQAADRAKAYYASADPLQQKKMQVKLVQAGYRHPNAIGYFLASRVGLGVFGLGIGVVFAMAFMTESQITQKALATVLVGALGYFLPNLIVNQQASQAAAANRAGFPDVMDLMVVCAEAGLTIEASVERIAQEISTTYPILSEHLHIAAIEVRAGRSLDDALRGFGERVALPEVQGFATMIQQSKELGTSVSDALRVYSDEMRYKRTMAAEEKAYALPAKLSIPVTGFILPIVIGVAIIPTIVRLVNQ